MRPTMRTRLSTERGLTAGKIRKRLRPCGKRLGSSEKCPLFRRMLSLAGRRLSEGVKGHQERRLHDAVKTRLRKKLAGDSQGVLTV